MKFEDMAELWSRSGSAKNSWEFYEHLARLEIQVALMHQHLSLPWYKRIFNKYPKEIK